MVTRVGAAVGVTAISSTSKALKTLEWTVVSIDTAHWSFQDCNWITAGNQDHFPDLDSNCRALCYSRSSNCFCRCRSDAVKGRWTWIFLHHSNYAGVGVPQLSEFSNAWSVKSRRCLFNRVRSDFWRFSKGYSSSGKFNYASAHCLQVTEEASRWHVHLRGRKFKVLPWEVGRWKLWHRGSKTRYSKMLI